MRAYEKKRFFFVAQNMVGASAETAVEIFERVASLFDAAIDLDLAITDTQYNE